MDRGTKGASHEYAGLISEIMQNQANLCVLPIKKDRLPFNFFISNKAFYVVKLQDSILVF